MRVDVVEDIDLSTNDFVFLQVDFHRHSRPKANEKNQDQRFEELFDSVENEDDEHEKAFKILIYA